EARAHAIHPDLNDYANARKGCRTKAAPFQCRHAPRTPHRLFHMNNHSSATKLDPREEHFRIPGPREGLSLFLRFLPAANPKPQWRRVVLYVHGGTFPSALSIAHRFDGTSWRDALNEADFDVWGIDFYGFGHSDRYPEMSQPAQDNQPLCVAEDAAKQLEAGVRFILAHQKVEKLTL